MGIPNMHLPTGSTLSRGVWRQTCHPLSFHPWLQPLSAPSDYTTGLHGTSCHVLLHGGWQVRCEGVMRVAHIDMRNTSNNCPAPLTLYKLIWERVCGSTNTTVLSGDSVTSPTNMRVEGCWVHFQCAVHACMHLTFLSIHDQVHTIPY